MKYFPYTRVAIIKEALGQRCKPENEYYLNTFDKWFYTFKIVMCVCLDLDAPKSYSLYDKIDVATVNGGTHYTPGEPTVHWAEWAIVGFGYFKNWWWDYYQDSD